MVGDSVIEVSPSEPSVLEVDPVPGTSTAGQRKRPREGRPERTERTKVFICETCKLKFTDARKFQAHAMRHDSEPGVARLHCLPCRWSVCSDKVADAVTTHLVSNGHSRLFAKINSPV